MDLPYSNADFYICKKVLTSNGVVSNACRRNENVCFMAQIKSFITGDYLSSELVDNITISVYKTTGTRWSEIEAWQNVAIPIDALLEEPASIDPDWTIDEIGPNFYWVSNDLNAPLFTSNGSYVVQIKISLTEGNPVVMTYQVKVI